MSNMDAVTMICPNLKCRKVLQVPENLRGQHVKCHYCGLIFAVPAARPDTNRPTAAAKKEG